MKSQIIEILERVGPPWAERKTLIMQEMVGLRDIYKLSAQDFMIRFQVHLIVGGVPNGQMRRLVNWSQIFETQ